MVSGLRVKLRSVGDDARIRRKNAKIGLSRLSHEIDVDKNRQE